ncbi:MAG TPA: heavy metal translocating P-type ATPase [Trichormus sp.]
MNAPLSQANSVLLDAASAEPDDDAHSSVRGTCTASDADAAPQIQLSYNIAHRAYGRLRLRVDNLRYDFAQASASLLSLASLSGVRSVRCNSWCANCIIEYDPEIWSEDGLLEHLDSITYGAHSNLVIPAPAVVFKQWPPVRLLRQFLLALERYLVPGLQVTVAAAAFACSVGRLPIALTRVLVAASAFPLVVRTSRTLLEERKIGIDALDCMAASLMIMNGKLIETSFMTVLIALGELIRDKTARRCEKIVHDLLGLSGRSAWLIRGNKRICVPADEVRVGEVVVVYPGDMIPVDGVVIAGEAAVDQAKMTGESVPLEVRLGDAVMASTVVVEGKINVRCVATGSQTKAGMVLQCISTAPLHETKIQNHASAFADKLIVPIFIAAGACFFATRDLARLMSMLILDFCTGIRIASPTAVLSAMHRAGRRGILIKSGGAMERLASVTAVVFDKTGTLTSGEPKVEEVAKFNGRSEDEVLALAAAVEMRLHHPAARAIVKAAQLRGLVIAERSESKFSRSLGVKAMVGDLEVLVGSKKMMESEGIAIDEARDAELRATKLGESISYVAIDGKVAGLIRYSDRLRPEVAKSMAQLRKLGIKKLVMATGDTQEAAERIAACCGITDVVAKAFPEEKAELVRQLKAAGHKVAVIGDGINDSPALAYADVAISLHGATDAAQQTADIVLTDDNLARLPEAVRISRSAIGLVKQNMAMAVIPNAAGFGMAAFGMLGPAGATILNNGSAIAATVNSLRPFYSNNWSATDL